jgi:hypothetical protein
VRERGGEDWDGMEWEENKEILFSDFFFFQLFSNVSILLFSVFVGSGSDASSLSTTATFDSQTNE